ncbi:alpha-N-arabinofuranosidase [Candidatus Latescibacterota bacterium]
MRSLIVLLLSVLLLTAAFQVSAAENTLIVNVFPDENAPVISRNIYGHFSEHLGRCIYEGYWVGEDSPIPNTRGIRNDVVAALKKIKCPVIRWPGGCFADEYHWMEGIGPRSERPEIVNTHWGGVTENNHFGTHEFFDLCELVGTEPFVCGNVGSGSVREMRDWVEYITFDGKSPMADLRRKNGRDEPWKMTYFAVGNENWGCGGNMSAKYYSDMYNHFQTYVRNYGDNRISKVACGPSGGDVEWTEVLMRDSGRRMNGLSVHNYVFLRGANGSATEFEEPAWYQALSGAFGHDEMLNRHEAIMDVYDPQKRVGIFFDEWGIWTNPEPGSTPGFLYQQNSLRDAVFAGVVLNIFNKHADRVQMANIAQTVNVLQAMILTDGADMLLTPTYHTFELYTVHHDAELLETNMTCGRYNAPEGVPAPPPTRGRRGGGGQSIPTLSASASRDESGAIHITVCNVDPSNAAPLTIDLRGATAKTVTGRVVTAPAINSYNTFENKEVVKPAAFTGASIKNGTVTATLPARSVVMLEIK